MIISILIIFIAGYLFKIFKNDYSKPLIDIVIFISFPALVIYKIYYLKYSNEILEIFFISFISLLFGMTFGFIISKIMKFDQKTSAAVLLTTTLGNTSFLGFPMVVSLFGEKNLIWAIFFDQIMFFGLIVFGSLFVAYGSEKKIDIKSMVIDTFKFPPFLALLSALFLRNFHLNLEFLKPVGNSLIFLVILAIGMRFSFSDVKKNIKLASLVLFIKMFLVPLSVYFSVYFFFDIKNPAFQVAFTESAMPPMVMASVLAIEAKLREDLAISAVGLGILLAFVLLPLYKYLLF
ncbi:AEC family transporter [Lebetimonas sp. JS138]|uniref:AEC family transporter n=1 Tax=Lebetimonas sp. JS138 TaxID=990072 RepID=UPI0004659B06|nr:AEC family transporter [Lebetimonas sp. JS138]